MLVQHYLDPMFGDKNTYMNSRYTLDELHLKGANKDDLEAFAYAKSAKKTVREMSRLCGYLKNPPPKQKPQPAKPQPARPQPKPQPTPHMKPKPKP
jgi:hypothetical protein